MGVSVRDLNLVPFLSWPKAEVWNPLFNFYTSLNPVSEMILDIHANKKI